MNSIAAKTLAAFGISGALALCVGAPGLAATSAASNEDQSAETFEYELSDVLAGVVCETALDEGCALCATHYLSLIDEPVEWLCCGASTYGIGDGLLGSNCSDGTTVTEDSMGVAHKSLPFGTCIQIMYNDKVVNAVVHDRGPFIEGRDLDFQPAVAYALDFDGVGEVSYRVIDEVYA